MTTKDRKKIEIVAVEGSKMYKCQKCSQISKRRYNMERHYIRFHEKMIFSKTCCGKYSLINKNDDRDF